MNRVASCVLRVASCQFMGQGLTPLGSTGGEVGRFPTQEAAPTGRWFSGRLLPGASAPGYQELAPSGHVKRVVLMLALLLIGMLPLPVHGQGSDCKAELREILRLQNDPRGASTARIKMQLSLTIVPRDSQETGIGHEAVTLICGDGKLLYESVEMRVYADANLTVNVLPAERTLYLSPGLSKRGTVPPNLNFAAVDDRLLTGAEVVACRKVGNGSRHMMLEIAKGAGELERHGIKRIRYVYDPAASRILEVRVTYVDKNPLAYILIRYEALDLEYRGPVLTGPVRSMFFANGDALNPKYKGYKVVKTNNQL